MHTTAFVGSPRGGDVVCGAVSCVQASSVDDYYYHITIGTGIYTCTLFQDFVCTAGGLRLRAASLALALYATVSDFP